MLSIIIPVFNEAENIPLIAQEVQRQCIDDYEILFVDDGSSDNSFGAIANLAQNNSSIKCISLSRNFGHQNALMAGMVSASGNYIIMMDCDLQHPPSLIPDMIAHLHNGFDIVVTKRKKTAEISASKKLLSSLFYKFLNGISDVKIDANAADFKGFNRKVLEAILQFKEKELFLRGIFSWVGFKSITIEFEAPQRIHGKTKYSFTKMIKLGLKGITSFSFKPLRIALLIGCIISLAAFTFAIFAFAAYFKGETVPGWASMIIAIMFLGGTQLLAIGLLGEYIASLFVETKSRPLFLVDKKINI